MQPARTADPTLTTVEEWVSVAFDRRKVHLVTPNAAVERRRAALSSAPRVHNEMTHMRRARDAV
jgi:hypothetical protein